MVILLFKLSLLGNMGMGMRVEYLSYVVLQMYNIVCNIYSTKERIKLFD